MHAVLVARPLLISPTDAWLREWSPAGVTQERSSGEQSEEDRDAIGEKPCEKCEEETIRFEALGQRLCDHEVKAKRGQKQEQQVHGSEQQTQRHHAEAAPGRPREDDPEQEDSYRSCKGRGATQPVLARV